MKAPSSQGSVRFEADPVKNQKSLERERKKRSPSASSAGGISQTYRGGSPGAGGGRFTPNLSNRMH